MKKTECSSKRERVSSMLKKDNAVGNFGDTILCPNCWSVREASSQSILGN